MLQERNFPLPIGKMRLFGSIFLAFVSGVFIFLGIKNYGLFALTNQIYFIFGVVAGLVFGVLEIRTVIPKLVKNVEVVVWQVVPIGIALFGIPLLLVIAFYGVSEYLPFGLYAFFPFITAAGVTSGWNFYKFEKVNKVDVFVFYYGFKYWRQPNPDYNERFQYFIRDVKSKDTSNFWGQIGSSFAYIGYSKIFIKNLKDKQEMNPETREDLIKILKTMNMFRITGLTIFGIFLLSGATLIFLFFGSAFGYIHLNFKIIDYLGPASGIIFFSFVISIFILMAIFKRKISKLLTNIDSGKLAI